MIAGTFEPKDLLAASWVHLRPRRAYAIVGSFLLASFLWAGWLSFFGKNARSDDWGRWIIPGVIGYFVFYLVWIPLQTRRTFKQRKDLQREVSIAIVDAGLEQTTQDSHGVKPWGDYLRWKEGKDLFLLYISDNMYQVVPKRFFSSVVEIDEFRTLLRKNVAGGGV
jgi:hypothetical protein